MKRFLVSLISVLFAVSAASPAQAAPIGATISITAPVANIYLSPIEMVATVRAANGNPVSGELVSWSFTGPVSVASATSFTDASGIAKVTVTPTTAAPTSTLVAVARINTNVVVSTSITLRGAFISPSPSSFDLSIQAPTNSEPGKSSPLTATLRSIYGTPIPGATITWATSGAGLISNGYGFTDSTGKSATNVIFGESDSGLSNITVTAQMGNVQVSKTVQISLPEPKNPLANVSAKISRADNRIRLEVVGADGMFVVLEIDGQWNIVEVFGNRFTETFSATKPQHTVAVFIEDQLFAKQTLSFPNPSKTITCRGLDRVLTVTGVKPICPTPFKVSKTPMPSNVQVTTCYRTGSTIRMAKPLVACPPGYRK
jgi:hypothetical protein